MLRRKVPVAPRFRQPPFYNPMTGKFARLGPEPLITRVSVFQVVEEDTHDNYVVCRGWNVDTDPNCQRLIENIPVAKPYDVRGTYPYQIANMVVVAKARTHLGDNPGVAAVSTGQPANLSEEVDVLTDDAGRPVEWAILAGGTGEVKVRFFKGTTTDDVDDEDETFEVSDLTALDGGEVPDPDSGDNWTINNSGFFIASDTTGTIIGDKDGNLNALVFAPKTVTKTVMTDFQVDTGSLKLQMKTQDVEVLSAGTESGWTDIHTGTQCE